MLEVTTAQIAHLPTAAAEVQPRHQLRGRIPANVVPGWVLSKYRRLRKQGHKAQAEDGLSDDEWALLQQQLRRLTPRQLNWLRGYCEAMNEFQSR